MHELTVRWDHSPQAGDDLSAFGRNGMFRCAGIHAYDLGGRIILRPLTGKGFPARGASIDLPADAAKLREIAAGLSAIAEQLEPGQPAPATSTSEDGILRVLDISTAHLSEQSCLWLEDREYGDSRELPVVAPTEYGWLLWVPDKATEADGDGIAPHGPHSEKPWPEDVCRVLRFAQERSCAYLLLDADGPLWGGLWSEDPDAEQPVPAGDTPSQARLPDGSVSSSDGRLRTVDAVPLDHGEQQETAHG
ncbi:MAG: hypothetical protein AB7I59_01705 [Geminicoccaceae bacterium]